MPIISFEIVEMHVPGRVLRQFGSSQYISVLAPRFARTNRNKKRSHDWRQKHNIYISKLDDLANQIQRYPNTLLVEYTLVLGITRRWIIQRLAVPVAY